MGTKCQPFWRNQSGWVNRTQTFLVPLGEFPRLHVFVFVGTFSSKSFTSKCRAIYHTYDYQDDDYRERSRDLPIYALIC